MKPGGAVFLWNLPKWNLLLGPFLASRLTFRHWIAVDIKYSLPIAKRLYPSHYSLLYYVKGSRPAIFHPDRLPVPCCRRCGRELKDYGGYKDKMNPNGVNLSDVWADISPVRHARYKKRQENALPVKVLDRVISIASDPGCLILDPFVGSGTTAVVAEFSHRRWIGIDLRGADGLARLSDMEADREHLRRIRAAKNTLFTADVINLRAKLGNPLSVKYKMNGKVAKSRNKHECDLFTAV